MVYKAVEEAFILAEIQNQTLREALASRSIKIEPDVTNITFDELIEKLYSDAAAQITEQEDRRILRNLLRHMRCRPHIYGRKSLYKNRHRRTILNVKP